MFLNTIANLHFRISCLNCIGLHSLKSSRFQAKIATINGGVKPKNVCGTVLSILSGLETRSLELNTLGTT